MTDFQVEIGNPILGVTPYNIKKGTDGITIATAAVTSRHAYIHVNESYENLSQSIFDYMTENYSLNGKLEWELT